MYNDDLYDMFSKITPDSSLKNKITDRIEGREMKKSTVKHTSGAVILAAAITAVLATTAFAMTPTGQETICSIIAYFQNDHATEMTSMEQLAKYNKEIGKSCSKDGITLTLDNVAADDNFIHVFYTVKSDGKPFYDGSDPKATLYSDIVNMRANIQCVIDGKLAGFGTNHNTRDGYFADNYTYKAAEKYNIASLQIPDSFKIELFGEVNESDEKESSEAFHKLYRDKYSEITDEDKAGIWYLSADIDKSKVKVESVTREINTKLPWTGSIVEKAVFSPFGNQLVVATETDNEGVYPFSVGGFALYDENDICLDLLNTDLCGVGNDGSAKNALEFLKADKDTKQLKFVPVKINEVGDCGVTENKIGQYPIVYKINNYGSVVVTDVRISDGQIAIDYYCDGFILYDPGFQLLDDNGNNAEPGGKLGCVLYTDVHYDTNSYTARYVYDKIDKNGNRVPPDESVSAESLKKSFTTLGVYNQSYIELDFDNTVTVNLK
ncbi:MAG: DUF4179 domain-containing protein [Clostridia bacterium]|nr:DUF4179 domain-containing protein [Clostridia bacterium]